MKKEYFNHSEILEKSYKKYMELLFESSIQNEGKEIMEYILDILSLLLSYYTKETD